MEIIRAISKGKEVCFLRCETHNWFYKGIPPLVSGCNSCWLCYFMGQLAESETEDQKAAIEQLESAIHHAAELDDKGEFDFVPYAHPEVDFSKEN